MLQCYTVIPSIISIWHLVQSESMAEPTRYGEHTLWRGERAWLNPQDMVSIPFGERRGHG
jgi:hypothetical protein